MLSWSSIILIVALAVFSVDRNNSSPSGSLVIIPITSSVSSKIDWSETGDIIGGSLTGIISTLKDVLTVERLILSLAVISTTPESETPSTNDRINNESEIYVFKPSIFSLTE